MTTTPQPRGKLGAMATQQVATAIRSRAVVNGPEDDVLVWDAVGWRAAEDDVRRLRQRIFTDLLEPDAVKAARPVLRGPRRSNALGVPDRVSHRFPAISATFDDPNLVSCAGLAPTMALAQRAGLTDLVSSTLTLKAVGGVNAHLKVPALVAGMVAGADSIDDMDLLRHG